MSDTAYTTAFDWVGSQLAFELRSADEKVLLFASTFDPTSDVARKRVVKAAAAKLPSKRETDVDELDGLILKKLAEGVPQAAPPASPCPVAALPEPWPQPVRGDALLDELHAIVRRFVVLPASAAAAIALWIAHSYLFSLFEYSPRLLVSSPEKRCGKSLLLRLVTALSARGLSVENITAPALFRSIGAFAPTLVLDEADTYLAGRNVSEDLRGVVNAGFQRGGKVLRCTGDDAEPTAFDVYAPLALGMIGRPPATIEDRSITVTMRRKLKTETVERLRPGRSLRETMQDTVRRLARWAQDSSGPLNMAEPAVPHELDDRAADIWFALLAIADAAGGIWPERARAAALELSTGRDAADSAGLRLLIDVRVIFTTAKAERLTTDHVLRELHALPESAWNDYRRGRSITGAQVARLLKPFGVEPRLIRFHSGVARGYQQADFADAWERYLPSSRIADVTGVTSCTDKGLRRPLGVTAARHVTAPNAHKSIYDTPVTPVTAPGTVDWLTADTPEADA